jgi:HK97 gp10 family phage protein
MANQSVKRFQALMAAVPEDVKAPIRRETFDQAAQLAEQMKQVVAVEQGTLRDSIRVETSSRDPMRALVRAGGPTTRSPSGYQYEHAIEFGTSRQAAQPFFWPTYRANKMRIRRAIRKASIAAINAKVPLR